MRAIGLTVYPDLRRSRSVKAVMEFLVGCIEGENQCIRPVKSSTQLSKAQAWLAREFSGGLPCPSVSRVDLPAHYPYRRNFYEAS